MAEFSKIIKSKYDFKTYESTKKAVEWILLSLKRLNMSSQKPKVNFLFDIGDIGCSCETMEDFVENAYGQKGYSLTQFKVIQFLHSNLCAYISSRNNDELYISTNNKNALEKIIQCLEETSLDDSDNVEIQKVAKIKQWIVAIVQNLLANWIWVIIVTIFTCVIAFFSKK
ncbi:MAG: hypothetical protein IJN74_04605 [Clostridia bacterium]|nr:hypothetical protein [Clostridia bacterium]